MVLDRPDWSSVSSGSYRYLGVIHVIAPGSNFAQYLIQPGERSIVLFPVSAAGGQVLAQAIGVVSGVATNQLVWNVLAGLSVYTPMAVPVSADIDTLWDVTADATSAGGTLDLYAWATSDPVPMANLAVPMPIALSDGQKYLLGQHVMGSSLPVAIASDQSVLSVRPFPVDYRTISSPATGLLATVALGAFAGFRWIVQYATFNITNQGAAIAANRVGIITDTASGAIWAINMDIPATAHSTNVQNAPAGIASASGSGLNIGFDAGQANISETVSIGVYQVAG